MPPFCKVCGHSHEWHSLSTKEFKIICMQCPDLTCGVYPPKEEKK